MIAIWTLLVGCARLPECADLCAARTDGIQAEIDAVGSDWETHTGHAGPGEYEDACYAAFDESFEEGARRRDLRRLCEAEVENLP